MAYGISTSTFDTASEIEIKRDSWDSSLSGTTLYEGAESPRPQDDDPSGRCRPKEFSSTWVEIVFVGSVAIPQFLDGYLLSGFLLLLPKLTEMFNLESSSTTWLASILSLGVASFLLPAGRLADKFGALSVFCTSITWTFVWVLLAGFSTDHTMLTACRAMQGLGGAAHLPSSSKLLDRLYTPGVRKNRVFSAYGTMAPVGSFAGILVAGLSSEYMPWHWYFWIAAIMLLLAMAGSYFASPLSLKVCEVRADVQMDWLGCATLSTASVLLVFSVIELAHAPQGWRTPYLLVTEVLGLLSLAAAIYIEGWVAEQPVLPLDLFQIKNVGSLLLGLLFGCGTVGIYLLYAVLYLKNVTGAGQMQLVLWFVPMVIGGCILTVLSGWLIQVVAGTAILILTAFAIMAASLLFALAPTEANYWAYLFPSMVCATLAIVLIFNVANVFLTTRLPKSRQGPAGALANAIVQLSIAFLLGIANVVATYTRNQGEMQAYKNVFWLEFTCGAVTLVIFACFVRLDRARRYEEPTSTLSESVGEVNPRSITPPGATDDRSRYINAFND